MLHSPAYSLETDRGYAEVYDYVKEFWACLLLFWLAWDKRQTLLAVWAAAMGWVLVDDSLLVHERVGAWLAGALYSSPGAGLRGQDIGEMTVYLTVLVLFAAGVAVTTRRTDAGTRAVHGDLLRFAGALAFFTVGVDMVHQWLSGTPYQLLAALVEESGEMLVLSGICWFVYHYAGAVRCGWLTFTARALRPTRVRE